MKKRVITYIQPTGKLHLGNYFGMIKNTIELLNNTKQYEGFIGIADMHAMTVNNKKIHFSNININSIDLVIQYLSCDINYSKISIFRQSQIELHTELAWILSCLTPLSLLKRMTQYKEKSKHKNGVNAGLLYYPILQAADILIYNANIVPVGKDQKQHLELTQYIAKTFNFYNKNFFNIPTPFFSQSGSKIMSLTNPLKKMSKSDDEKSVIFLYDDPKIIFEKIMCSMTDSMGTILFRETQPGISNLLKILSLCKNEKIEFLEKCFKNYSYVDFKKIVAEHLIQFLTPIQKKYYNLCKQKNLIIDILNKGYNNVYPIAKKTLKNIYNIYSK